LDCSLFGEANRIKQTHDPSHLESLWPLAFSHIANQSFKISTDPFFVARVRDVVGLYLNPPEKAVVLCVDEKSQIQALNRTQPILPMGLGYVRRGHA